MPDRARLTTGLIVSALVSSCGGSEQPADRESTPTTATSSAAKACDVLTEADAEKALGRDASKLEGSGGPAGLDMCQYGYQGERLMDAGQATLTVQPVDIASLRQGVTDQGWATEPVEGLGDEAFWSKEAGLYVGKGNRTGIYLVGVGGEGEERNKLRTKDLAKATVARL